MAFERIKTVKGHEYKYRVKSTRKNGRVRQEIVEYLGRADKDKEQVSTCGLTIPYGLYYFAQEGCDSCMNEEELCKKIELYMQRAGVVVPAIHYINLSKMANPTGIVIVQTPTLVDCEEGKLFVDTSGRRDRYIQYKIGEERYREISEAINNEDKKARMDEIKDLIQEGKKYRELCGMGYDREEVKTCIEEFKTGKSNKCKDGVCALPQSGAL